MQALSETFNGLMEINCFSLVVPMGLQSAGILPGTRLERSKMRSDSAKLAQLHTITSMTL